MERPVLQLQSSSRRNRRSSFLGTEAVKLLVPSPVGRNPVPPSLVEERSGIAEGRNSPSFSTTHRKFNSVDSGDSQNLDPNSMLSESFDFSDISPKVLRQLSAGKQRKSKGSAHGESPLLHMVLGESPRSSRSSRSNSLLDDSFVTANDERSACSDIDSPCGDAFGNYTVKNQMGSFGSPSSLRNKSLRLKHNNGSTEKHHGPLQPLSSSINYAVQQFDFNRINEENASLKRQLRQKDDIIEKLYSRNTSLQAENERLDNLRAMSIEDVHATNFMNGILELKISELEDVISQDRLKHNEKLASKVKKHKAQAKKLNEERQSYENRANQMIQQMTEQMTLLQKTAMERIQTLENELFTQRHNTSKLQAEVLTLRASLSVSDKKTNEKKRDLLLSPSLALSPTTNQMSKKPNPLLSSRLSSTLNSSIGSTGSSATLCNDETPEEDDVILYEDMDDDNNNEDSEIIEEDYVEHSHFNQVEENENN